MRMTMIILMTGSEGYIGSHLKPYLETKELPRAHTTSPQIKVEPYVGDICNFYMSYIPDFIIHLAALTGVRKSVDNPEEYHHVNVIGTRKIFKYAEHHNITLLFASSSNALEVNNPYAQTKLTNEQERPTNSVGVRPHTVYPGRPDMLYQKLLKGKVEYIQGNHYRDFNHIDDFCSAIFIIIEHYDSLVGDVIDIGSGKSVSVLEVAKSMGFTGEVRYDETPTERKTTCANIGSLIKYGWKPEKRIL